MVQRKPFARLVVLSTNPEMAIKSLASGNFELFWYIFTKIDACGSPILPFDCGVILYDVFKAICDVYKVFFSHLQLSGGIWHIHNTSKA